MKLKHLFLFFTCIIATALVTTFIYDFVHNLNTENLINATSNNLAVNNQIIQISERDVQNAVKAVEKATSNITSTNNSTMDEINGVPKATFIVGITLAGVLTVTAIGFIGYNLWKVYYGQSPNQDIPLGVRQT